MPGLRDRHDLFLAPTQKGQATPTFTYQFFGSAPRFPPWGRGGFLDGQRKHSLSQTCP